MAIRNRDVTCGTSATDKENTVTTATQTSIDLTDSEAEFLLRLLYRNDPGPVTTPGDDADMWGKVRSKVAGRLGRR